MFALQDHEITTTLLGFDISLGELSIAIDVGYSCTKAAPPRDDPAYCPPLPRVSPLTCSPLSLLSSLAPPLPSPPLPSKLLKYTTKRHTDNKQPTPEPDPNLSHHPTIRHSQPPNPSELTRTRPAANRHLGPSPQGPGCRAEYLARLSVRSRLWSVTRPTLLSPPSRTSRTSLWWACFTSELASVAVDRSSAVRTLMAHLHTPC